MNAQQFLTWMRNPSTTSREESAQLDALLDAFPYFQSGHLLYIKNLHNQGSFLYNNQLKTAAAYAVNRKVLYELITLSALGSEQSDKKVTSALDSARSDKTVSQEKSSTADSEESTLDSTRSDKTVSQETLSTLDSARSDKTVSQEKSSTADSKESTLDSARSDKTVSPEKEEQISEPIKFPPKKFTKDPDEWEAGMLRQLQLLHHWKKSGDEMNSAQYAVRSAQSVTEKEQLSNEKSPEEKVNNRQETTEHTPEEIPAAKDEINTLLYVLVEPGQPEDLDTEITEELIAETADEPVHTEWEITPAAEHEFIHSETEQKQEVVKPSDPVQQEILLEAIHSTFELEVDDKLPSAEELQPFKLEALPETAPEPVIETTKAEQEVVVDSFEKMSFSDWLKEVSKQKTPAELPKTPLSGDKLIEDFIREEPRIKVKKSGFFNPVNMAKKSVQESDEFLTETLARIYAKQGNYPKAIRAYQKLSLKFPEKTAYFAALIEELKRTPNK